MFIISRQLDGGNRLGEVIDIGRITLRVELNPKVYQKSIRYTYSWLPLLHLFPPSCLFSIRFV